MIGGFPYFRKPSYVCVVSTAIYSQQMASHLERPMTNQWMEWTLQSPTANHEKLPCCVVSLWWLQGDSATVQH